MARKKGKQRAKARPLDGARPQFELLHGAGEGSGQADELDPREVFLGGMTREDTRETFLGGVTREDAREAFLGRPWRERRDG